MRKHAVVALVSLALVAANAPSARAEDENDAAAVEARKRYAEGTKAFARKHFADAAEAFEAAAALRPHAVPLYTAGLAWEQAGQPERAADAFARALEAPGLTEKQEVPAREKLTALEKSLATVNVRGPAGTRVQLESFTEVPVPARLHAGGGPRLLRVIPESGPPEERELTLKQGEMLDLDVTPKAPEPEAPKVATPAARAEERPAQKGAPSWRSPAGFALVGAGIVGVGAGVVLGVQALDAKGAYDDAPTRRTYDHASALQTWTNVAFIAGGALAVAGVALLVWPAGAEGKAKVTAVARPGGLALEGAFE